MARCEDIRPGILGWDADDVAGSLEGLYGYVKGKADTAIEWYLKSKNPKKRWAISLRTGAIVLVCIAGAISLLLGRIGQRWEATRAPQWRHTA